MNNLDDLLHEALTLFNSIDDAVELEQAKARYLGRNGKLTELLKGLGKLLSGRTTRNGQSHQSSKRTAGSSIYQRRDAIREKKLESS